MRRIMLRQCGKYCNIKIDDFIISTGKQYSIKQFIFKYGFKSPKNENKNEKEKFKSKE